MHDPQTYSDLSYWLGKEQLYSLSFGAVASRLVCRLSIGPIMIVPKRCFPIDSNLGHTSMFL